MIPAATDSQAIIYGVKQAKYRMLEEVHHSCDSHMNEREKAFIDEYIQFLAAAMCFFLTSERYGWKAIRD